MHDPKAPDADIEPENPNTERVAGQADDLDRGTGTGASGGGLGKSTGFWPEKPAIDDLKKAGADPNFDASLEEGKRAEH
jgi:hypothetical protein